MLGDLGSWLAGEWSVQRYISGGRGTFRGRASFTPRQDGTTRWHEAGQLVLDGHEGPASRTLTLDPDGQVRFDDGRPFHRLDLATGRCEAEHLCAPDTYRGTFEVLDDATLIVTWRVRGPGRDDTIRSHYTRHTE